MENTPQAKILTVSELTRDIQHVLEQRFPFVWITGEISNTRVPASGHLYFSLKDAQAQITAVMFRGQNRLLAFNVENGMAVVGLGRISVYAPRGTYQIILEYLEPKGAGSLHVAFEQLKSKLAAEGLFDAEHKRDLPFLPQKIALLTSASGAVVHDFTRIAQRRFANIQIEVIDVTVQGENAVAEMVAALETLNQQKIVPDLIVLARGGGSMEDLQPFNTEALARAIFASKIPVVSAVGHETDYTIADFVADLRAPTPSAAAELSVPVKDHLVARLEALHNNLTRALTVQLDRARTRTTALTQRLRSPRRRVENWSMRLDELYLRLQRCMQSDVARRRELWAWRFDKLVDASPLNLLKLYNMKHDKIYQKLLNNMLLTYSNNNHAHAEISARLSALNPQRVLDRGYSIVRSVKRREIISDPKQVHPGQTLEVQVSKGIFSVNVTPKK